MDASSKPRRRAADPFNRLPPALRGRIRPDTADTVELWRRYQVEGDPAAFRALVEHYLPIAFIAAWKVQRSTKLFREDLSELVSDAHLGLIRAIRNTDPYVDHVRQEWLFYTYAKMCAMTSARREVLGRRWPTRHYAKRNGTIEGVRARLVQEHGRLPTPAELSEALRGLVTNPGIQIGDAPDVGPIIRRHVAAHADPQAREPGELAVDRETIRLAMEGLGALDRKILKLLIDGHAKAEIARRLQLSPRTVSRRCNGVLWEARSRADLARHLGVAPVQHRPAKRTQRPGVDVYIGDRLNDTQRAAARLVAGGMSDIKTAARVGVHRITVLKWRLYFQAFRDEVERLRAGGESRRRVG